MVYFEKDFTYKVVLKKKRKKKKEKQTNKQTKYLTWVNNKMICTKKGKREPQIPKINSNKTLGKFRS